MIIVYPFLAPTLLVKELLDAFTQACQVFYAALPINLVYSHRSVCECKEREGGKETRKKKSKWGGERKWVGISDFLREPFGYKESKHRSSVTTQGNMKLSIWRKQRTAVGGHARENSQLACECKSWIFPVWKNFLHLTASPSWVAWMQRCYGLPAETMPIWHNQKSCRRSTLPSWYLYLFIIFSEKSSWLRLLCVLLLTE